MNDEQRIVQIIADKLGYPESDITCDAKFFETLGADSLDVVEMIMTLEEEFGIEISDEEVQNMITVGNAVTLILAKRACSGFVTEWR